MNKVFTARKFQPNQMFSLGNASYMIIRQYNFPNTYEDNENHMTRDSDRVFQQKYEHAMECVKKHTRSSGNLYLDSWLEKAKDTEVIEFIKEFLNADQNVQWTGFRILGSVGGNGSNIYTLELFAKSPDSTTEVYSGREAPNVEK